MSENQPTTGDFDAPDCSAVIADLWLLLDNECDQEAAARIRAHIRDCPSCLEHHDVQAQLKALVARKCGGERAPDGLRERLRVEIRRSVTIRQTTIHIDPDA